jgi:7-carboxy-7-deazaguanine synthase
MNNMTTSKRYTDPLPVMESFYTLQGEGMHQGRAAFFIRLGGCDVGCTWCDVKDSWDMTAHPLRSIDEILKEIPEGLTPIVVVTGGEPLMHDLGPLTSAIHAIGLKAHIETSGSHPLSGHWDWICLSPKKFKAPLDEVVRQAHELKVVVYHKSDLAWAGSFAKKVAPTCRLYLQPEWSKAEEMTPRIVDHIKMHPEWTLSLQVHKYINVP